MALLRRAGILSILAVLALGLVGTVADAKKMHKRKVHSWGSQVTLTHPSGTEFRGTVSSKLSACRSSRLVTVYYTDPNTGQTQPLSAQRTTKQGDYDVPLSSPAYAGNYQARVSKLKIQALKAPQLCRGAWSAAVTSSTPTPAIP